MAQAWYGGVLADTLPRQPGPPLIRDNLVFYGGIIAAALAVLLVLVWLRRRWR
jgi:hypothetical protein